LAERSGDLAIELQPQDGQIFDGVLDTGAADAVVSLAVMTEDLASSRLAAATECTLPIHGAWVYLTVHISRIC